MHALSPTLLVYSTRGRFYCELLSIFDVGNSPKCLLCYSIIVVIIRSFVVINSIKGFLTPLNVFIIMMHIDWSFVCVCASGTPEESKVDFPSPGCLYSLPTIFQLIFNGYKDKNTNFTNPNQCFYLFIFQVTVFVLVYTGKDIMESSYSKDREANKIIA